MLRLSRTVEFAIHTTLALALSADNETIPASRLALDGSVPEDIALHILRMLEAQGILHSTWDNGTVFMLARKPADISLLDLVEATDGFPAAQPVKSRTLVSGVEKRLWELFRQLESVSRHSLQGLTISELISCSRASPRTDA